MVFGIAEHPLVKSQSVEKAVFEDICCGFGSMSLLYLLFGAKLSRFLPSENAASASCSKRSFWSEVLGRSLELSYLFDTLQCPSLRASNGMDLQHSVRKQSHVLGCGLWHEKPTFVASCGLMCPQNHTCRGLTRMFSLQKIASRSEDYSELSSL